MTLPPRDTVPDATVPPVVAHTGHQVRPSPGFPEFCNNNEKAAVPFNGVRGVHASRGRPVVGDMSRSAPVLQTVSSSRPACSFRRTVAATSVWVLPERRHLRRRRRARAPPLSGIDRNYRRGLRRLALSGCCNRDDCAVEERHVWCTQRRTCWLACSLLAVVAHVACAGSQSHASVRESEWLFRMPVESLY